MICALMKPVEPNEYCPCCGYDTFDLIDRGNYSICPICYWEDDPIQFKEPDLSGGANRVSLIAGQNNFLSFGACEYDTSKNVRKPINKDNWNPKWKNNEK